MALVFNGNCEWRMIRKEPTKAANDLPTHIETWIGRSDKFTDFMAAHPVGMQLSGGYIIFRRGDDSEPKSEVELTIATAPDFQTPRVMPGTSTKTAQKTATVSSSTIIDGATEVKAERAVSYEAPETKYTYFSSTRPGGPRYSKVSDGRQPRILRTTMKASANGEEVSFGSGNAPAALVSALTMAATDVVTSHDAEPIDGTPWYRCADVVTRELQGD